MKKKHSLLLLLQLALVVGFSFSFYTYVQKEVEPTKVFMYADKIEVGGKAKVFIKEVPLKGVQDKMLTVKEVKQEMGKVDASDEEALKYVGKKFLATDVDKDQYVYEDQLVEEGKLDPFKTMDLSKYRKVSLPISYVEGFGGDIKRGDRIDLIFTGQGKKQGANGDENFQYSKTFLQDVLVYNVTTENGFQFKNHSDLAEGEVADGENAKLSTENYSEELAVITLAVTLDQAEEINARKSIGTISFASRFEDNQSYETLGYVIGNYEKIFSAPANAETGRVTIN